MWFISVTEQRQRALKTDLHFPFVLSKICKVIPFQHSLLYLYVAYEANSFGCDIEHQAACDISLLERNPWLF